MDEKKFYQENLRQTIIKYKRGELNLSKACSQISIDTGLQEEIIACFLKVMKRENILQMTKGASNYDWTNKSRWAKRYEWAPS